VQTPGVAPPRKELIVNMFAAGAVMLGLAATLFFVLPMIEQRIDRDHAPMRSSRRQ
jgi:hypothetical protein